MTQAAPSGREAEAWAVAEAEAEGVERGLSTGLQPVH